MADVSAKDGSQETIVNLVASIVGIVLLAFINDEQYVWGVFLFFTAIHLLTNYFAVRSLIFTQLNETRLLLVIKAYLRLDTVSSVLTINSREPLILGCGPSAQELCGFKIKLGCSLKHISTLLTVKQFEEIVTINGEKNYMIIPNFQDRILYVPLLQHEKSEQVISAFFHAIMMGIALCKYNKLPADTNMKRQLFPRNISGDVRGLPIASLCWNTNIHTFDVDSWRYSYTVDKDS